MVFDVRITVLRSWFLFTLALATLPFAAAQDRIVAIGDIHGDYTAFEQVITRAGLMDAKGDWVGGDTVFVQTGDIPDRGPDTRRIIHALHKLKRQAVQTGGQVILLVGNHEAMNVIGDLRYVHPGEYAAFKDEETAALRTAYFQKHKLRIIHDYRKKQPELSETQIHTQWETDTQPGFVAHRNAWAPDGELGELVVGNPVIAVVGDTLFAHGGPSAKYTAYSIDEINHMATKALKAQNRSRDTLLRDSLGPLWYRALIRKPSETHESDINHQAISIEAELTKILDHFGVKRIVVGHTYNLEGIKGNHDARVIQIDTGMSSHYGGVSAFLEITPKGVFADNNGVTTKLSD